MLQPQVTSVISASTIEQLLQQARLDGVQKFVVAPLLRSGERLLILRRREDEDFLPGIWEIPGGGVETGEDLVSALARETREETGCEVRSVNRYVSCFDYRDGKGRLTRQFNFEVSVQDDRTIRLTEHDRHAWVDGASFGSDQMSPEMLKVVRSAFA